MKLVTYLIAAIVAFFGVMFVVGAQGQIMRLVVGIILLAAAGVLIYLTRVQPKKEEITHVQKIDLTGDVHPCLARLRTTEPVSWLPAIGGWLVTAREPALAVLRDTESFTVDDPRFSTARVVGPSMLSTDGDDHARHRTPFAAAFRQVPVRDGFEAWTSAEARRLLAGHLAIGRCDLREVLAGPLAATSLGQCTPR